MASLSDIANNLDALKDFNSLPRNERIKVINQIDPSFKEMKLKDRFDVLDHMEGHTPESHTVLAEATRPFREIPSTVGKGIEAIRGGLAGTGVGIEKAITTPGSFSERAQQAILAAAPATKPGYKPQEGEKLGYYAGKFSPELAAAGMAAGEAAISGAKTLVAPTVKAAYETLDDVLAKNSVNPGISEITENTPKAIAEYAKNTKELLAKGLNKGREFLAEEPDTLLGKKVPGEIPPETTLNPSRLERIREDITRIFNNKWESPKTQVGKDLAQAKEAATEKLTELVPPIKDALSKVKSAYDKEDLVDTIIKASKILGAGVAFEAGRSVIGGKGTGLIKKLGGAIE